VKLSVPPGTPEGQHAFHLLVANVANPDEQFAIGPSVAFQVQRPAPMAQKKFPWWIVALAAGVLLITAGAITAGKLLRNDEEPSSEPVMTESPSPEPPSAEPPPPPSRPKPVREERARVVVTPPPRRVVVTPAPGRTVRDHRDEPGAAPRVRVR
jgi:hypothetical protein